MEIIEARVINTTGDAAQELGLSADRVRQLARSGRLPALRTKGGQFLFLGEDVDRLKIERAAGISRAI